MDFSDAKDALRQIYLNLGYAVEEEKPKQITLTHPDSAHPLVVNEAVISDYAAVGDRIHLYKAAPSAVSIVSTSFREQRLVASGFPSFNYGEKVYTFGNANDGSTYVEVGPATPTFKSITRTLPDTQPWILSRQNLRKTFRLDRQFDLMETIRVYNIKSVDENDLINKTDELFESILFELSYRTKDHRERGTQWPRPISIVQEDAEEETPNFEFPLRNIIYGAEVTSFYRRGAASEDPFTSFLSFYHVAEYFFVTVSDEILYHRMAGILNDPRFSAVPASMDRVIQTVHDHRRESDETEMLKDVLSRYVDESLIIKKIAEIEQTDLGKVYTTPSTCFGYDLDKMSLQKGHVYGPLAKRIKIIRNCLVHSSDRRDRKDRYVPGFSSNRTLNRELPLMRFLAEQIVINSATARVL